MSQSINSRRTCLGHCSHSAAGSAFTHFLRCVPTVALCALLITSGVEAVRAEGVEGGDVPSFTDSTSEYVREYLSDPRRAGSLVGSILGGALTAHPAGPMLGGVIGFLVGKQTMYEEMQRPGAAFALAPAQRPIVPPAGTSATLSFNDPRGVEFGGGQAAQAVPVPATANAPVARVTSSAERVVAQVQSGLPAPLPSPAPTVTMAMGREQIAAVCAGDAASAFDPRLRNLCYYAMAR